MSVFNKHNCINYFVNEVNIHFFFIYDNVILIERLS